jgi:hypothetical protein
MLWRLYLYDTLLKGLAQPLEPVAAARRPLIQKEDAVVRPRHLARPPWSPGGRVAPRITPTPMLG